MARFTTQNTDGYDAAGELLNFRVTEEFRMRFRMYAVKHNMQLSAVLVEAFEALVRERGVDLVCAAAQGREG